MKVEPASIAAHPVTPTGISIAFAQRIFNATLDIDDGQERTRPYLAEALPRLNTDSWRVSPDGTMETTWRLKPNLSWHDGTPLSAEDFAFAARLYTQPDLAQSTTPPFPQIQEVVAADARTVVFRWKQLYPQADSLGNDFQALPRHILEAPFAQGDMIALSNHLFWSSQYVGLGPYKLERWDPGASIQAVAFDGHVGGRPRIDRVQIRFVPDENTALTQLLSGDVQFASDRTIRFEQAQVLRQQWGTAGGTAVLTPAQPRHLAVQQRPEFANPRMLTDTKGRQALAHALDRQALNDGLFEGQGSPTETPITPFFQAYSDVDRAITRYPYDPRRAEQLLGEMGYAKGTDGFFALGGERLSVGFMQEAGDQTQREMSIIADTWRRLGIDSATTVMSSTQLRDGQVRSTFPGVYSTAMGGAVKGGTRNLSNLTISKIGTAATRWQGSNYGGWSSASYDRLYDTFATTLDPIQRNQQVVQLAKMLSDDVAVIMLFFNFNVSAHSAALTGPESNAFDTLIDWNVETWTMK
jgi:peptide/nickel transport system substrate-binding protein